MIVPFLEAGHGKKRIAPSLTPLIDRSSFTPASLSSYPIWPPIPVPRRVSPNLTFRSCSLFILFFIFLRLVVSWFSQACVTLTSISLALLATDPCFFPFGTLFALFCLLSTHCSLYHPVSFRQLHPLRPKQYVLLSLDCRTRSQFVFE